jgi:enamine deaminase RidA (YjgF/YER057c/UK114 family)/quercetin dioxygenase-like cupin family protein
MTEPGWGPGEALPAGEISDAIGSELLYENEAVRVWVMDLVPGQAAPRHRHRLDYLFVYTTPSRIKLCQDGQPDVVEEFQDGFTRFVSVDEPIVHHIENVASHPHRQVLVELKRDGGRGAAGTNGRARAVTGEGPAGATPEERLAELGLELPGRATPVGSYIGASQSGDLLFVSGHGPYRDGEYRYLGKVGRELDVPTAQEAAELVILNFLRTVKDHVGELARVSRVHKLLVLVNSAPDFTEQHRVAEGASRVLLDVFGEDVGRHGRSAIGVATLPLGISVEIEGVIGVTPR